MSFIFSSKKRRLREIEEQKAIERATIKEEVELSAEDMIEDTLGYFSIDTRWIDPTDLLILRHTKTFCDSIVKDPSLYKYVPDFIIDYSTMRTESAYYYLQGELDMEDLFNKVYNAINHPGVFEKDPENERAYVNLFKDVFFFRRSHGDREAFDKVEHPERSKIKIREHVENIEKYRHDPYNNRREMIKGEYRQIVKEIMKYPHLIDNVPQSILNQHKVGLINDFYDTLSEMYGKDVEYIRKDIEDDKNLNIGLSIYDEEFEKIIEKLDDYYKYVEKAELDVKDSEFYDPIGEKEFEKQIDFYEKNIVDSQPSFIGEDFYSNISEPQEENFEEFDIADYYKDKYNMEPINYVDEEKKEVKNMENIDVETFDYDLYVENDEDYMPSIEDGYDEKSFIINGERSYLEIVERTGIIDIEFKNLVEKLSSKDELQLDDSEIEDIQSKLSQLISFKSDLYLELPEKLSNPFIADNRNFFINLNEQIKIQGNELNEPLLRDCRAFNDRESMNRNIKNIETFNKAKTMDMEDLER